MPRKRQYSPISVDGEENQYSISHATKDTRCLKERTVFKPASGQLSEDHFPSFLLKNVVVYKEDRVTFANLLNAELEGPFFVRGLLAIEDNEKRGLAHCKL